MADAAQSLPQALIDEIQAIATEEFAYCKQTMTDAHRAKTEEHMAKVATEEFRNEMTAKIVASFAEADANNDGLLDLAEWRVWMASFKAQAVADGVWHDDRDQVERNYNLANRVTEGTDGVT